MVKVIIFDYYGVLTGDFYWTEVRRIQENSGHAEHMRRLSDDVNLNHISWDDFCEAVASDIGATAEEVKLRYDQHRINRDVVRLIHSLGQKFRVVLLSNANEYQLLPKLDELGLTDFFERVFVSSQLGMLKPDREIYEFVARELGVQPEDCVMVDDLPINIDGAKSAGMHGVIFDSAAQARTALQTIIGSTL